MNTHPIYSDRFFDMVDDTSSQSASVVVPILLDLIDPKRVVDIGCGRGAWLRVFQQHGVRQLRGFDGAYVNREKLLIDAAAFSEADLAGEFEIDGNYDLALCLEVLEHLPDRAGRNIVKQMTASAPLVLFSAAIPGQFGQQHINLQWPGYWQSLFADHGFEFLDPVRPRVRDDARVEWWYRQNLVLYASTSHLAASPALRAVRDLSTGPILEWVHHNVLMHSLAECRRGQRWFSISRLRRRLSRAANRQGFAK